MNKSIVIVIAVIALGFVFIHEKEPEVQKLLKADNVVYYDDAIVTRCGTIKELETAFLCGDKIYVGQPWFADLPIGVQIFVMAHELGHKYDDVDNGLFEDEQYADCYAGTRLEELFERGILDYDDLADVRTQLTEWGSDSHGTSQERWFAVMDGIRDKNCTMYNEVV